MTLILFTLVIKCQPGKSDRGCGSGWYLWRLHNCPLQICSAFLFLLKIQDLSQIEKHRRWCQFQNKLGVTPKQLKKRARAISVYLHLIYRCETSWLTERFQENSCVSEAGVICAGVSSHFYFCHIQQQCKKGRYLIPLIDDTAPQWLAQISYEARD